MNRTTKKLTSLLITLAFSASSLFGGILTAGAEHLEIDALNDAVTAAQEAEILAQDAVTATNKSFIAAQTTYTAAQNLVYLAEALPEVGATIASLEQIKTFIDTVLQKTEDLSGQGSIPEAQKALAAREATPEGDTLGAAQTAYDFAVNTRGSAELAMTTTMDILAIATSTTVTTDIKVAVRNTLNASISARDAAETAYKEAVEVRRKAGVAVSRAQRTVAQAEADDAVTEYNRQLGETIGGDATAYSDSVPDVGNATTIGDVTAACLAAATTKAAASAITTKLIPLVTAGTTEGAAAATSAGSASVLSVPVSDVVLSTFVGRLQGTSFTHAAQATVVEPFLDALAYNTAQCALDQLTNSVVTWIKGGGVGSPKYAVNTEQLFADYAGQVANDLAREIRGLAICNFTPDFKLNFANAIDRSTHLRNGFTDQVSCPFGSGQFIAFGAEETSAAIQDIGWQGFEKSLGDKGNPFGVTVLTNRELALRQTKGEDQQKQKLSWSNGFADIVDTTDCEYPAESTPVGYYDNPENTEPPFSIALLMNEPDTEENSAAKRFYEKTYCKTTTPGKMIGDQLTKSLGLDADRLGFVDNMNKIIGALIEQISKKATETTFNKLNDVFGNDEN